MKKKDHLTERIQHEVDAEYYTPRVKLTEQQRKKYNRENRRKKMQARSRKVNRQK